MTPTSRTRLVPKQCGAQRSLAIRAERQETNSQPRLRGRELPSRTSDALRSVVSLNCSRRSRSRSASIVAPARHLGQAEFEKAGPFHTSFLAEPFSTVGRTLSCMDGRPILDFV